jgi:hypothetical protein
MEIKEFNRSHSIKSPKFGDCVLFIDHPTKKDLEDAKEKQFIIICRMQGTVEEKLAKANKLREELGDNFKSNYLCLDGRYVDEDIFSKENYEKKIKEIFNQDYSKSLWNAPAGYTRVILKKENKIKKIYYAHPMYLYNTPQEKRDIELLENLGFEVLNPNSEPYISQYKVLLKKNIHDMKFWVALARACDAIAFRGCPDGRILSGVGAEISENIDMPIIELPSMIQKRIITNVEETRAFLAEIGER